MDVDNYLERLMKCELISDNEVKELTIKAKEVLIEENNIVMMSSPVNIVGDIHGQFYDLVNMFNIIGPVVKTNYLFLGDYVNRGKFSIQVFLLLLCLKLKYPENVVLLRGNHESRILTYTYGFYDECRKNYGSSNVWKYCTDLFDYLSLAAIINSKVFCVHGGIADKCLIDDVSVFFVLFWQIRCEKMKKNIGFFFQDFHFF